MMMILSEYELATSCSSLPGRFRPMCDVLANGRWLMPGTIGGIIGRAGPGAEWGPTPV